jgi:hypothetical protein
MCDFFIQMDLHSYKCFLKFVVATRVFKPGLKWK